MMSAAVPDTLSEEAHDVLRTAVTIARNSSIGKVAVLKLRLHQLFPDTTEAVIDEALTYWAKWERRSALQAG